MVFKPLNLCSNVLWKNHKDGFVSLFTVSLFTFFTCAMSNINRTHSVLMSTVRHWQASISSLAWHLVSCGGSLIFMETPRSCNLVKLKPQLPPIVCRPSDTCLLQHLYHSLFWRQKTSCFITDISWHLYAASIPKGSFQSSFPGFYLLTFLLLAPESPSFAWSICLSIKVLRQVQRKFFRWMKKNFKSRDDSPVPPPNFWTGGDRGHRKIWIQISLSVCYITLAKLFNLYVCSYSAA